MFSKLFFVFVVLIAVINVVADKLRSAQAPKNWVDVDTSLIGQYVYAVAADGTISKSSVYAKQWQTVATATPYNKAITTDYTGRLVYSIGSEIGKSDNYGATFTTCNKNDLAWTDIKTDLWGQWVYAISSTNGLYVSNDWGNTWTQRGPSTGVVAVDTNRYTCSQFHLNCQDSNAWIVTQSGDLYKTADDGTTWSLVSSGKFGSDPVTSIETDDFGGLVFVGTKSGKLFRSSNNGKSFTLVQKLANGPISTISCDNSCQRVAYAVGDYTNNVAGNLYESTDSGLTFSQSSYGTHVWTSIATSKPGNFIYAANYDGSVGKIH